MQNIPPLLMGEPNILQFINDIILLKNAVRYSHEVSFVYNDRDYIKNPSPKEVERKDLLYFIKFVEGLIRASGVRVITRETQRVNKRLCDKIQESERAIVCTTQALAQRVNSESTSNAKQEFSAVYNKIVLDEDSVIQLLFENPVKPLFPVFVKQTYDFREKHTFFAAVLITLEKLHVHRPESILFLQEKYACAAPIPYPDMSVATIFEYYEDGTKKRERWYKNGKIERDGDQPSYVDYYPDGKVEMKMYDHDGAAWRENDEPCYVSYYNSGACNKKIWHNKNDKKHRDNGLPAWIEWDVDGNITVERYFVDGKEIIRS